jgi:hypothetical protein
MADVVGNSACDIRQPLNPLMDRLPDAERMVPIPRQPDNLSPDLALWTLGPRYRVG